MAESEKIVYRTREVEVTKGEGSLKEKPKSEKPLVVGTSDPDMVDRELRAAADFRNSERSKNYQPQKNESTQNQQSLIETEQVQAPEKPTIQDNITTKEPEKIRTDSSVDNLETTITSQKEPNRLQLVSVSYQYIGPIGEGGFSVVDKYRDSSGLVLAFKRPEGQSIKIAGLTDPEARIKALGLMREEKLRINSLAQEGSKYTPRFALDATYENIPGIFVEFIEGESLEKVIEEGIDPKEVFNILRKAADPIKRLHARKDAHMDIKPSNYIRDKKRDPILIDLSPKMRDQAINPGQSLIISQVTKSGKSIGTPLYMAPEQKAGKVDPDKEHLVDVYQLSSLAYEMLTGMFPDGTVDPLIEFPRIVEAFGKDKAQKLDELLKKGRSRNPLKRPQSVDDLLEEMEFILEKKDNKNRAPQNYQTPRNKEDKIECKIVSVEDMYVGEDIDPIAELEKLAEDDDKEYIDPLAQSGILDLVDESEDTSLGAELLEEIYTGEEDREYVDPLAINELDLRECIQEIIGKRLTAPYLEYSRQISISRGKYEIGLLDFDPEGKGETSSNWDLILWERNPDLETRARKISEVYGAHLQIKFRKSRIDRNIRAYNLETVLEKIKERDFGFLVQDNKKREPQAQSLEGARIIYNLIRPILKSNIGIQKTCEKLVYEGIATDLESAEKIMDELTHLKKIPMRGFFIKSFNLAKRYDSKGKNGYSIMSNPYP